MKHYCGFQLLFLCICQLLSLAYLGWCVQAIAPPSLTLIAEFVTVDYLWDANHSRALYEETGQFVVANNAITGIKVSKAGEIFVSVPRWMSGVPSSLNKLVQNPYGDGTGYVLNPWPSWEFNEINRTGSLQYAQSFIIDSQNLMWIPEVGRTNFADANPSLETSGPAGIFVVNISDGSVVRNYYFPEEVVSYNSSFVNDIVLDEVNGYAYFSNTWGPGGIIVYNINRNTSHSFTGVVTNRNASYDFCVNGICYGTDGVGAFPSDGIALSDDGSTLYWSPLQGQGLYSIQASLLWNFSMPNSEFFEKTLFLGYRTGPADGLLWLNGNLYYGNNAASELGTLADISQYQTAESISEADSVMSYSSPSTLNWLDTFSEDLTNSNAFYFTTNKLNLFFSSSMDFTGQSGANFRIFYADTGTSTTDDTGSSTSSKSSLSDGAIVGVTLACITGFLGVVGGIIFLMGRCGKQSPSLLSSRV